MICSIGRKLPVASLTFTPSRSNSSPCVSSRRPTRIAICSNAPASTPASLSAMPKVVARSAVMPSVIISPRTVSSIASVSLIASPNSAPPPSASVRLPSTPRNRSTTPATPSKPSLTEPFSSRNERDRSALFLSACAVSVLCLVVNAARALEIWARDAAMLFAASSIDDVAPLTSAPSLTSTPSATTSDPLWPHRQAHDLGLLLELLFIDGRLPLEPRGGRGDVRRRVPVVVLHHGAQTRERQELTDILPRPPRSRCEVGVHVRPIYGLGRGVSPGRATSNPDTLTTA